MRKQKQVKKPVNKLYKMVYKGKVYTGYNRDILVDFIMGLKLK